MIRGFVETARVFQVRGWAFDDAAPERRLDIQAWLDTSIIGRARADVPREDLRQAGIGDGAHGFVLETEAAVPVDAPDRLRVHALAGGEPVALPFGDDFRAIPNIVDAGIRGYVGAIGADAVSGWAWNPAVPDEHLTVELRLDRKVMGAIKADQFRPDLARAKIGAGDHGFTLRPRQILGAADFDRLEVAVVLPDGARQYLPLSVRRVAKPRPDRRIPAPDLPIRDPSHRPVFILGPQRAGTSALAQGLLASTRYRGPHEGHLLDIIVALRRAIDRFYEERAADRLAAGDTLIAAVPPSFLKDSSLAILVGWARAYFPEGLWLDKTPRPEAILAAPIFQSIWPRARFIFAYREARANVASQRRKFPWKDFETICRLWADSQRAWLSVRDRLGDQAVQVDQAELATAPAAVAARLAMFLDLTAGEQAKLAQAFTYDWPEQTMPRPGAGQQGAAGVWSEAEEAIFARVCGAVGAS